MYWMLVFLSCSIYPSLQDLCPSPSPKHPLSHSQDQISSHCICLTCLFFRDCPAWLWSPAPLEAWGSTSQLTMFPSEFPWALLSFPALNCICAQGELICTQAARWAPWGLASPAAWPKYPHRLSRKQLHHFSLFRLTGASSSVFPCRRCHRACLWEDRSWECPRSVSLCLVKGSLAVFRRSQQGHVAVLDYRLLGLVTIEERFFLSHKRAARTRKLHPQRPLKMKGLGTLDLALTAPWKTVEWNGFTLILFF